VIEALGITRISDGILRREIDRVVEEVPLARYINGRHVQTVMMSPSMVKDLDEFDRDGKIVISSNIVLNSVSAGIPAIVSKGAVTNLAVRVGKISGATVVGFVRKGGMVVYTGEVGV